MNEDIGQAFNIFTNSAPSTRSRANAVQLTIYNYVYSKSAARPGGPAHGRRERRTCRAGSGGCKGRVFVLVSLRIDVRATQPLSRKRKGLVDLELFRWAGSFLWRSECAPVVRAESITISILKLYSELYTHNTPGKVARSTSRFRFLTTQQLGPKVVKLSSYQYANHVLQLFPGGYFCGYTSNGNTKKHKRNMVSRREEQYKAHKAESISTLQSISCCLRSHKSKRLPQVRPRVPRPARRLAAVGKPVEI